MRTLFQAATIFAATCLTPAMCHAGAAQFEAPPPGEAAQIAELVDLTGKLLEQRYGAGSGDTMARRAVHPKAHGCVMADFAINSDIPEKYRVGVFATPGKTYKAWIRYSNATGTVTPDVGKLGASSRGMAIKLLGVEGDTLLGETGPKTQDFLLINQPMFAFPDVSEYLAGTRVQFANKENILPFLADPAHRTTAEIVRTVIAPSQLANPLDATYFSASPFLYGDDKAAKFAASPRHPAIPSLTPKEPTNDYLREAMKKTLGSSGAAPVTFDFQVQLRPDGLAPTDANYPIENAAKKWETDGAPFQTVARITIPPQDFDQPLQATECEHLVFTPWHGLRAHQPLGGINRLRKDVYIASSKRRAQTIEPSGYPQWR
jgi:hypothetical protein